MDTFEKLGAFYLGHRYDLHAGSKTDEPLLYDSKDLTTHAVCVGMTGSGKTGLCITLLEEAAIDGLPALVIDPKGDLSNLMLTFPELSAKDFRPWINLDTARQKNLSPDDFAKQQAELWQTGLEGSGQSGDRIQRLRDAAEVSIYTPGSSAGIPVSILSSLAGPGQEVRNDSELLAERVSTTVSSLLGLLQIDADPIRSREHILLSSILQHEWQQGHGLDLQQLIQMVQTPPIRRIGVIELEAFYPSKERFELAMAINSLLASPQFQSWLEGEALDIQRLLYTETGKPRIAIFSIAHLSESERMFFVSLLLNQTLGWMRGCAGTTTLRALLYMDEIYGYLPPVANPPSKAPFLTLLKQARAYGLGLVLATQNPVDLDYKALSNCGTWFVGRMQAERDKKRMIEGLTSIAAGEQGLDAEMLEKTINSLGKRVFLLHNVHERHPVTFHTRWALSYLAGPMTRDQIKKLMKGKKPSDERPGSTLTVLAKSEAKKASTRPVLPPGVPEVFVAPRVHVAGEQLVYQPALLALSKVHFPNTTYKRELAYLMQLDDTAPDWELAEECVEVSGLKGGLSKTPVAGASFAPLPRSASVAKNYGKWEKTCSDFLYRTQRVALFSSKVYKLTSKPDESEVDFRVRVGELSRKARDKKVEKLRKKYTDKLAKLEDRIQRAQATAEKRTDAAKGQTVQTAISFATTVLSAFLGRKTVSSTSLGRATTAARGVSRSRRASGDAARAKARVENLLEKYEQLELEFEDEVAELEDSFDPEEIKLSEKQLKPRRADIQIKRFGLVWLPFVRAEDGRLTSVR